MLPARYYELRLLSLTGFQPRLFNCLHCGEPILEQDQAFSGAPVPSRPWRSR